MAAALSYRVQQLPLFEYGVSSNTPSPDQDQWYQCDTRPNSSLPNHVLEQAEGTSLRTFTISTFNRWFDQRDSALRTVALLQILRDSSADVFCLQEMTAGCLFQLKLDPTVQSKWYISNRDGVFGVSYGSSTWYGQMTLIRKQTASVIDARDVYLKYQGNELRPLHIVDIEHKVSGRRLQIINVHLQSLQKEGIARMHQVMLAAALAHQATPKITLLAGDTNFYSEEGMQVPSREGFIDVWKTMRPNEPGHTFGVTYAPPEGQVERRIDGIFQWPNRDLELISVEIYGQEHLQGHPGVFLSDHCGLTAQFHQG